MEDKKKLSLFGFLKKIKTEYLILFALLIVALIVFFSFNGKSTESNESTVTVNEYVDQLETKLKNCLKQVKGAGKVDVIISVGSSMQTVFATQSAVSANGQNTVSPIIVSGKPVVVKETYPEIVGVVIVAEGAGNLSVKIDLLNACETFLSITEDRIQILPMK